MCRLSGLDKMVIFGGTDGSKSAFNDIHTYDINEGSWVLNVLVNETIIPSARKGHSAVCLNNTMILYGDVHPISHLPSPCPCTPPFSSSPSLTLVAASRMHAQGYLLFAFTLMCRFLQASFLCLSPNSNHVVQTGQGQPTKQKISQNTQVSENNNGTDHDHLSSV